MAKASKKKSAEAPAFNVDLMKAIASGQVNRVSKADGEAMVNAGLIEVNQADLDDKGNALVRLTDAGNKYLADQTSNVSDTSAPAASETVSEFAIIEGAEIPESKRGNRGGGAPQKYPFDKLEIGQSFFVPKSADMPDPVKTLGSTVSSANRRFSEVTGEKKQVERTKRTDGNKAVRDAAGKPVREPVTIDVRKPLRKFTIRGVEKGKAYGKFTAPADGALIARVALKVA